MPASTDPHASPADFPVSTFVATKEAASLEHANVEGEPTQIGRDPRIMTEAELSALGHSKRPLLAAIRQNCIECCAGAVAEVRRCRMIACPMWPYRMGTNPFRAVREVSEDQLEVLRARGRILSGNSTGNRAPGSVEME
jgi:hypothetical protein